MSTRDFALDAARQGWHVFPCRPGDKRPKVKEWEQRACADPNAVAFHWPAGANIGIACGPSRLYVVDLDMPKPDTVRPEGLDDDITNGIDVFTRMLAERGEPWPETYTVTTTRGGLYLYFRAPAARLGNTSGRLGWLIDTRCWGGFVVGAGSVVDGKAYEVLRQDDLAELPGWIAAALTPPPHTRRPFGPPPRVDNKYVASAVRNEIQRVLDAVPSTRNKHPERRGVQPGHAHRRWAPGPGDSRDGPHTSGRGDRTRPGPRLRPAGHRSHDQQWPDQGRPEPEARQGAPVSQAEDIFNEAWSSGSQEATDEQILGGLYDDAGHAKEHFNEDVEDLDGTRRSSRPACASGGPSGRRSRRSSTTSASAWTSSPRAAAATGAAGRGHHGRGARHGAAGEGV